jgi:hypothetical protein
MFRKLLNIAFALFFTSATMGVSIQGYFCDNEIISLHLGNTSEKCCENQCSHCRISVIEFRVTACFIHSVKYKFSQEELTFKYQSLNRFSAQHIKFDNRKCLIDYSSFLARPEPTSSRAQLQVYLC